MQKLVYMLEDDQDDRMLTDEMVAELGLPLRMRYFSNSIELVRAMQQELPSMVLIDFNAPPSGAIAAMQQIRNGVEQPVPMVVLTESNTKNNSYQCYKAGAASVIRKPDRIEETRQRIRQFFTYWLEVAEV